MDVTREKVDQDILNFNSSVFIHIDLHCIKDKKDSYVKWNMVLLLQKISHNKGSWQQAFVINLIYLVCETLPSQKVASMYDDVIYAFLY